MRNPDITAKEACPRCNNTGTIVINGRNYSYSVPCSRPLPVEQPELKERISEVQVMETKNQVA